MLLAAGINDGVEHAVELAELLHRWGRGSHVNLIPFNPIEGSEYRRPYKKVVSLVVPTTVEFFLITFYVLLLPEDKAHLTFSQAFGPIEVWIEVVLILLIFWLIGRC